MCIMHPLVICLFRNQALSNMQGSLEMTLTHMAVYKQIGAPLPLEMRPGVQAVWLSAETAANGISSQSMNVSEQTGL